MGGGARTNANGLDFEFKTDIYRLIEENENYTKLGDLIIRTGGIPYACFCGKGKLYTFLANEFGITGSNLSRRLYPDDAIYFYDTQTLVIVEKKFQENDGSVDEKPQNCNYKQWVYKRLVQGTGIQIKLIYLFNDWFKDPKYSDMLDYMKECGVDYYFNSIPVETLGLDFS